MAFELRARKASKCSKPSELFPGEQVKCSRNKPFAPYVALVIVFQHSNRKLKQTSISIYPTR